MKSETTTRRSRKLPLLAITLLSLLIFQITGCKSVPEGSATMKQQALSFTPPEGKAGIYVIRPYQFAGSAVLNKISLDYQGFGSLETSSYLYGTVSPGEHTLRSNDPNSGFALSRFTVEAGKNCYFTVRRGLAHNGAIQFESISETDGQALVQKCKLSGDNRFEPQNAPGQ
jgi:hypothetical protein